jgi:cytoskeletal protein RodZ
MLSLPVTLMLWGMAWFTMGVISYAYKPDFSRNHTLVKKTLRVTAMTLSFTFAVVLALLAWFFKSQWKQAELSCPSATSERSSPTARWPAPLLPPPVSSVQPTKTTLPTPDATPPQAANPYTPTPLPQPPPTAARDIFAKATAPKTCDPLAGSSTHVWVPPTPSHMISQREPFRHPPTAPPRLRDPPSSAASDLSATASVAMTHTPPQAQPLQFKAALRQHPPRRDPVFFLQERQEQRQESSDS